MARLTKDKKQKRKLLVNWGVRRPVSQTRFRRRIAPETHTVTGRHTQSNRAIRTLHIVLFWARNKHAVLRFCE